MSTDREPTDPPPCAGCIGCGGPDCIERPDTSGPHPDTARTDPDTTQHHTADQPGHHPDGVRTRLAAVIDEGFRTFDADKTEDASLIESLTDSVLAFLQSRTQRLEAQLAQVEDLLCIAHDTSNRSEAERAQAVGRTEEAEAHVKRLADLADRLGTTEHQQRAVIARVREQCAEWARPIKSGSWDAQIRDDIAASCAEMILRALDTPHEPTGPERSGQ